MQLLRKERGYKTYIIYRGKLCIKRPKCSYGQTALKIPNENNEGMKLKTHWEG